MKTDEQTEINLTIFKISYYHWEFNTETNYEYGTLISLKICMFKLVQDNLFWHKEKNKYFF